MLFRLSNVDLRKLHEGENNLLSLFSKIMILKHRDVVVMWFKYFKVNAKVMVLNTGAALILARHHSTFATLRPGVVYVLL